MVANNLTDDHFYPQKAFTGQIKLKLNLLKAMCLVTVTSRTSRL
ncbi:hypothetical protein HMPREF3192_01166 [Atopobium deltae]|uniref:Uncharacterized protein n=1 Tax=Atopobium deltae TaxID=1393034 RepID=A0A133XSK8_9ACTN|nr:hypothetical protein HMPREF3192_01166 [Atopobium deltae]